MANVIFKYGTKPLFDAVEQKDINTLYWLTDVQEVYKGDVLFGSGRVATETNDGLMSAADKAKLDDLAAGTVAGLVPVDATIVIADGESGEKTIGVQVSEETGNTIEVKADGLFVAAGAEYAIKKLDAATEGFSASYQLQKTVNGEATLVGDIVNIPKDLVLQSGSLEIVETADQPYAGAQVGDPYIDLVLNNADSTHIYVPMKGIVDTEALKDTYVTNGLTSLSEGAAANNILAAIGSYDKLLAAINANKIIVDHVEYGGTDYTPKVAIYTYATSVAANLVFMTSADTVTTYQVQNVGGTLALGVTSIQLAHKSELPDTDTIESIIDSLPDEIISEIVNVQRTETTNTAEIRIFTKQEDGTYSPETQHGVLTLISAGQGPDGVNGAGLMSAADKQKLDSIDTEVISGLVESLVWGSL